MERKISFKNLYLVGVISLGLLGLGVGSTFAMFTASAEISDSISMTSGLEYTDDVVDLVDMTISSNKVETATLNITNNTSKTLNYTSWYMTDSNSLQIGTVVSNNNSVTGTISPNGTVQIIVSIRNRGTGVAKVSVGISASEGDIVVSDGVTTLPTDSLPPYLNDYITSLYTNANKSTVTNNSITYNYATDVNLMNDRLGSTDTDIDEGNIRYYGNNPNNYIDIGDKTVNEVRQGNWERWLPGQFSNETDCLEAIQSQWNAETAAVTGYETAQQFCSLTTIPAGTPILWRIIGVFDEKIRIRRDEAINGYSFDTSASNVNDGYGINEWSQADLMKLLNPGYETNTDYDTDGETEITVNNSLYWNSGIGKCYNSSSYANTDCDFTNTGLSDEAKEYVVDQTISLGGFNTTSVFANEAWANERGSNVFDSTKSCYGQSYCNDTITRTLTWTGKVALIYPSDFGYAVDFRDSNCQGNLSTLSSCTENWMVQGYSWTVSPWASDAHDEMRVDVGNFDNGIARDIAGGWPVLTLNSKVVLESGTGTSSDPFVID